MTSNNPAPNRRRLTFDCPLELDQALDRARGDVPRGEWVRRALYGSLVRSHDEHDAAQMTGDAIDAIVTCADALRDCAVMQRAEYVRAIRLHLIRLKREFGL